MYADEQRRRAVWTRFQPIAYAVEEVIKSGILGKPKRFSADFSMGWDIDGTLSYPCLTIHNHY